MSGLIGGSSAKTLRVKEFRASGAFARPAGVKTVDLFLVGGGAGSGANSGGDGGNVMEISYDVSEKASCAVIIGAGGAVGNTAGGASSFDGVVIASGGAPCSFDATVRPVYATGKNGFGGAGVPKYGGASANGGGKGGAAAPADNTGGGGGGDSGSGSPGASGYCRVEWYE